MDTIAILKVLKALNRLNSGKVKYSPCYTPRNKWMVEVYGWDVEDGGGGGGGGVGYQGR